MVDQSEPRLLDGFGIKPLNPFLDIELHGRERCPPRRVYAFVESSESLDHNQIIKLSAIDADWFDKHAHKFMVNGTRSKFDFFAGAELWILEMLLPTAVDRASLERVELLPPYRLDLGTDGPAAGRRALIEATRRGWWHVELDDRPPASSALDMRLYSNLFAQCWRPGARFAGGRRNSDASSWLVPVKAKPVSV